MTVKQHNFNDFEVAQDDFNNYEVVQYNQSTNVSALIKTKDDIEPFTFGLHLGGVYFIDENTFYYPKEQHDDFELEHEYRPFNIWYSGILRFFKPNTVGYYEAYAEYLTDRTLKRNKSNDEPLLGDIRGVVQFHPNTRVLALNRGDIVELNNLHHAIVLEVINDTYILEILNNDYFENIPFNTDKYGNIISRSMDVIAHADEGVGLGWFNIKNIITKGED